MKRALFVLALAAAGPALVVAAQAQEPAPVEACASLAQLKAKEKSDLEALNAQISTLREQIKPLEEQKKTLEEQDSNQRETLLSQIDPAYASARQSYNDQMKSLREREAQELKAIREKYEAERHSIPAPKANLNCR